MYKRIFDSRTTTLKWNLISNVKYNNHFQSFIVIRIYVDFYKTIKNK